MNFNLIIRKEIIIKDKKLLGHEGEHNDKAKPLLFTIFANSIFPTSKLMHKRASPQGASLEGKRQNSWLCS